MNLVKFSRQLLSLMVIISAIFFSLCESDLTEIIDNDNTLIDPDCAGSSSTFTINLNANECGVDIQSILDEKSLYQESVTGSTRNIKVNGITSHNVGTFPNPGNPNTISVQSSSYKF